VFCGAGGSSIGLPEAGYELALAANHWPSELSERIGIGAKQ
jgi:site-specific DNA-cytosine methylase